MQHSYTDILLLGDSNTKNDSIKSKKPILNENRLKYLTSLINRDIYNLIDESKLLSKDFEEEFNRLVNEFCDIQIFKENNLWLLIEAIKYKESRILRMNDGHKDKTIEDRNKMIKEKEEEIFKLKKLPGHKPPKDKQTKTLVNYFIRIALYYRKYPTTRELHSEIYSYESWRTLLNNPFFISEIIKTVSNKMNRKNIRKENSDYLLELYNILGTHTERCLKLKSKFNINPNADIIDSEIY
jgi:hypothetical protein